MIGQRMNGSARQVPLIAWAIVVLTLLFIPAKIISYGYLPEDDALRHAAKAVSGKPWSEILVMRSDFTLDPHPGWHAILGGLHRMFDCNAESLVELSVVGLMLLISLAVLPWFRRPEAWLAALLTAAVFIPYFIGRLTLGRPYLFTMASGLFLVVLWSRIRGRRPRALECFCTILLVAGAAWIHGSFYQMIFPAAALFLAGATTEAFWFGGCWVAGSVLGAALTGHPWAFLAQCLRLLAVCFGDFTVARQLVLEFQPLDGSPVFVLAVAAMLLWRMRREVSKAESLVHPLFIMGLLGWVLGMRMQRFWWDWGAPALVLWIGFEFEKQFERAIGFDSLKRLLLVGSLAAAAYIGTTSDLGGRWTANLSKRYLTPEDPDLTGWLPEKGGLIYSPDMQVFCDTFFKNPDAPWRYVLGFEPTLMQPEDLDVLRKIQWQSRNFGAYQPWVKKMTPADRLILPVRWVGAGPPEIPVLEWHYAAGDFWIGRIPQSANGSRAPGP